MGFQRPYIFALLYIWLEFFRPQIIAPLGFEGTSLTVIIGVLALIGLIVNAPSRVLKPRIDTILLIIFSIVITLTTNFAMVQPEAWVKWDWAIKGVVFAALLGQFTKTRQEFEAAVLVMIAASSHQILSYAIKTALGGGGYEVDLGVLGYMTVGLGESSALSVYCACLLPILSAFSRHSIIIKNNRWRHWTARIIMLCCILAPAGTFARTALLSLGVSIFGLVFRRSLAMKVSIFIAFAAVLAISDIADTQWGKRMSTTASFKQDTSAMGRVAVWYWTIDFIKEKPFGGGFLVDRTNRFTVDIDTAEGAGTGQLEVYGKAFHSIYFEVLGEHGWPGFVLYFWIVLISITRLFRVWRAAKNTPEAIWEREMAYAFLVSWIALLVGGAFIGIAFMQFMFLMMVFSNSIYYFYIEKYGEGVGGNIKLPQGGLY
jgi:probable O-glycosylation ligase (exosortase A-associated)